MNTITITTEDTKETLTFEYENMLELILQNKDSFLAMNDIEGRSRHTFWRNPEEKEKYRLKCLEEVNG